MLKLNQLQNALAVAEYESFLRAAEAKSISQPAMSRSIQQLEKSIGVVLFNREPDRVTPTEFGKRLLARAKTIVNETEEIQREMKQLKGLGAGSLSVSMGPYPADLSGYQAISELVRQHPKLHCQVSIDKWQIIIQQVIEHSIDLGVAECSTLKHNDPTLAVEPLGRHELVFFCRKGHPLLGRNKLAKADFDGYPLAAIELPPRAAKLFPGTIKINKSTGLPSPALEIDDLAITWKIVEQTDAFAAATPAQLEPWLKRGELSILPYRRSWLTLNYGFIYQRRHQLSPAAKKYMELSRSIEARLEDKNRELMKQVFPNPKKANSVAKSK